MTQTGPSSQGLRHVGVDDSCRFPDLVQAAAAAVAHCAEAVAAACETAVAKGLDLDAATIPTWSLVHELAGLPIDGTTQGPPLEDLRAALGRGRILEETWA